MDKQQAENLFKKIGSHDISNFHDIVPNFVKKKILEKGYGRFKPEEGKELLVHYIGELKDDGRNVDNTYVAKEPHCFILGRNSITYGLELGIKSMVIGEKAVILVEPEYGHLPLEQFKNNQSNKKFMDSALSVDFDTSKLEVNEAKKYLPIIYEVELIYIDEPRKQKQELSTNEKLEIASELKNKGINSFKSEAYKEAEKHFLIALDYLTQVPSNELNQIMDLKFSLNLNIANCLINLNQYTYCLQRLEKTFELKINAKCYYYRAIARMHLAEFSKAETDINKLCDYLPGDPIITTLRNRLDFLKEEYNKKTVKLVKNSMSSLYDDKENEDKTFPSFNKDNKAFYLDVIKNDNKKNPFKLKFEIYEEDWAEVIIRAISNNSGKHFVTKNKDLKIDDKEISKRIVSLGDNYNISDFGKLISEIQKRKTQIEREATISVGVVDDKKRRFLFYRNSIFPACVSGLLCLYLPYNSEKNENINLTPYCELFISLESFSNTLEENIVVLGKCFYNQVFLNELNNEDQVNIISQGISLNLV